ncbi:mucoidy inhibitor MuiA family protein [Flavobacterium capsici]|uniref:Mucoidy inhibitor MuiA family protein n=1 Tax=Flavobacterium capsici TaxID=3075618 RepID=A0AA96F1F0_9FLAO|nr:MULTISPECIES: mucoidy inhibitor MuiA family protein [unclassified Flavobacterium]WNM18353.1 mucoidy inhibitor MuiA family protein [Flavobacterium sp. PMR2A8]WNM22404.1 mucoidy inhibitor MuiA family protein [Flavobacterium sp. PMTSA4]
MRVFILLLLSSVSFFATDIKTKAKVKEVTVYTSGAQISSEVGTTIPKGASVVRITDVSPFIIENTIQINGLKEVSILSIGFEVAAYPKKVLSEKIKSLETEIASRQREIALLQNTIRGLEEEKSILSLNKNLGSTQQAATLEKILLHSKHYRERLPVLEMEVYDTNKKIAGLNEELRLKQLEYQKTLGDANENKGEIILKFDNPNEAVSLNLGLKYLVTGAGWVPSYEIKAKNSKDGLDFSYKAQVYQTTGEDWNDVKLTLSTGNPTYNNDKPTVEPHYLNFINPYSYNGSSAYDKKTNFVYNPMVKTVTGVVTDKMGPLPGVNVMIKGTNVGTQTDFDGRYTIKIEKGQELVYSFVGMENLSLPIYSNTMNVSLKESSTSLQEVVVVGYATKSKRVDDSSIEADEEVLTGTGDEKEIIMNTVTFKIKKSYSIPSLDTPSIIEIDNFSMPAEFEYYTAPLLSESVYLTAKVKDWNKYDLLPGDASIYTEGSYAGTTFLNPYQTEEELVISMGMDSNLIVERKQVNNLKAKSLLGGTRIVDRNYEITLRNNKPIEVTVKVYDRIPVSQNKEIKVEKTTVDNADFDEKTGILFWQLTLPSKQLVKKQLGYQVKYPKSKRVNL